MRQVQGQGRMPACGMRISVVHVESKAPLQLKAPDDLKCDLRSVGEDHGGEAWSGPLKPVSALGP